MLGIDGGDVKSRKDKKEGASEWGGKMFAALQVVITRKIFVVI